VEHSGDTRQRHRPATAALGQGGRVDVESSSVEHASDLTGWSQHLHYANLGQPQVGRVSEPDALRYAFSGSVAQSKARRRPPLAAKRGKPTTAPARWPFFEPSQFARAWAASLLAHSKTDSGISPRQDRPRVASSFTGELSSCPFFQALNSLMKEILDQERPGVSAAPQYAFSDDRTYRLSFTRPRW